MIVQPTFFVPLLAGEAIAFAGKASQARFTVRGVLLAVDPFPRVVDDQITAAEVVAKVELHGRGRIVRERSANADKRNPALIIHHVHSVILLRRTALNKSVMLKYT